MRTIVCFIRTFVLLLDTGVTFYGVCVMWVGWPPSCHISGTYSRQLHSTTRSHVPHPLALDVGSALTSHRCVSQHTGVVGIPRTGRASHEHMLCYISLAATAGGVVSVVRTRSDTKNHCGAGGGFERSRSEHRARGIYAVQRGHGCGRRRGGIRPL